MNLEEIERTLRRRRVGSFDGMFAADELPDNPHLLVANTDPASQPGRHWVCICVEKMVVGNISTRLGDNPLRISNATWTDTARHGH